MKFHRYLIALLPFITLCSCGSDTHASSGSTGSETEQLQENVDTVAVAEEIVVEEAPIKTGPDLPTPQLQMAHMRGSDNWEKYETGILPQMVEDAPEYSRQILETDGKRFIIVDKAKMKLFLYDPYGNIEKSYGIACAKNYGTKKKKGDSRTTEGIFKVKGVFDSTEWLFTDDNGYTSPVKGQYGPRFIRLNIPYIGIHGTGSPGSIGKRCSHGCIRVTNANILELVKYVEEGMAVIISPGPRDMAVNQKEGSAILSVSTEPGKPRAVPGWAAEPAKPSADTPASEEPAEEPSAVTEPSEETGTSAPSQEPADETPENGAETAPAAVNQEIITE